MKCLKKWKWGRFKKMKMDEEVKVNVKEDRHGGEIKSKNNRKYRNDSWNEYVEC